MCSQLGCEKEAVAHGLCKSHYMVWYRENRATGDALDKFWNEARYEDYWNFVKEELKIV